MHRFDSDIPTFESPFDFGDKVVCTSCGKTGANYNGSADSGGSGYSGGSGSSQRGNYSCKSCMHRFDSDIPTFESPFDFGDKVVCTSCGKTGANYNGSA